MAVKIERELSEAQHSHFLRAVAAIELKNLDYAISLLQGILKQEPEFLTGRQLLRRAEVTRAKAMKKSLFNVSSAPLAVMKTQRELKKNPKLASEMAEKILEDEPYHRHANLLLKEAALAAGWPETAAFALQTLLEEKPRDTKVLHELGRVYHAMGQNEQEVDVYNRILEIEPGDAEASRLGKDASARSSMRSGGWATAESYRELIKDKGVAVALEQQNRMTVSGSALEQQIAEMFEYHEAEPENVGFARRLGALHEQKGDTETAIAWLQYAAKLMKEPNAELDRKISELMNMQATQEIVELEEFLAAHESGHELYPEKAARLEVARKTQADLLISEVQTHLEKNPTDLQLRFELGRHLVNARRFREALPELQRARQRPNARLKALNLLGVCYRELGMLDLAAKQLEEAAKEITAVDATKKEILYNLASVYEAMNDSDRSLACLKQIYEADYGYRDVAARVERSYGTGPAAEE